MGYSAAAMAHAACNCSCAALIHSSEGRLATHQRLQVAQLLPCVRDAVDAKHKHAMPLGAAQQDRVPAECHAMYIHCAMPYHATCHAMPMPMPHHGTCHAMPMPSPCRAMPMPAHAPVDGQRCERGEAPQLRKRLTIDADLQIVQSQRTQTPAGGTSQGRQRQRCNPSCIAVSTVVNMLTSTQTAAAAVAAA